jgi:hypothetical protein
MKLKNLFAFAMLILFFAGCARNYKLVNMETLSYQTNSFSDSIKVVCNASPMLETSNIRYQKYLTRLNITILAVKIQNLSNRPLPINASSIQLLNGGVPTDLLDPAIATKSIHQPGLLYLLWSLFYINVFETKTNGYGETETKRIAIIPIGAAIGLGNAMASANADMKFHQQMASQSLINKTIQPGGEAIGFLATYGLYRGDLKIKRR